MPDEMPDEKDEIDNILESIRQLYGDDGLYQHVDHLASAGADQTDRLIGILESQDEDRLVRRAVMEALGKIGIRNPEIRDQVAPPIRNVLEAGRPDLMTSACLALGYLKDSEAIPLIKAGPLRDKDNYIRLSAATALTEIGDPTIGPILVEILRDSDPGVRRQAAFGLGQLKDLQWFSALFDQLRLEPEYWIQSEIVQAMGEIHVSHDAHQREAQLESLTLEDRKNLLQAFIERESPTLLPSITFLKKLAMADIDRTLLGDYGPDLVERAHSGTLPNVHGRDEDIERLYQRITQPTGARGVVLLGPTGSGKTSIVHGLSHLLKERTGEDWAVIQASTGEIMKGTRFIGEWETRLLGLINAIKSPRPVIWYLPDIDHILGAGTTIHSSQSFASVLAPHIEDGSIAIIGESTPERFRSGLERNPSMRRLFHLLHVEEMDEPKTRVVLDAVATELASDMEQESGFPVPLGTGAISRVLELASGYLPSVALPGKAIDLLQEAFEIRKEDMESVDFDPAALVIDTDCVTRALARHTGMPVYLLDDATPLDVPKIKEFFRERVLGQEEGVEALTDLITLIKAGLTDPTKPLGVLLFLGPTGVGKTEIAKALAELLFGSQDRLLRLDMTEYKDPLSIEKLIGNPQTVDPRGAMASGKLTDQVRQRPWSVVLLDEFEKAHPNVFDLFLQVFDDGRLTDARGDTVDLRQTIIIMTSNLKTSKRDGDRLGFLPNAHGHAGDEQIRRALKDTFRPEFVGRIDRIVQFNPLDKDIMRKIAQREAGRVLLRTGIVRRNLVVDVDPTAIGLLLREGFSPEFGARPLKQAVERLLLLPLAKRIVQIGACSEGDVLRIAAQDGKMAVRLVKARRPSSRQAAIPELKALKGQDIDSLLDESSERIDVLEEWLESEGLRDRRAALLEETCTVTFWDDVSRARETLAEHNTLERILSQPPRLRKRIADSRRLIENLRAKGKSDELEELTGRIADIQRDLEFCEYSAHCRVPLERSDAYITITRVDEGGAPATDVSLLAKMYRSWARRKGFDWHPVFESLNSEGEIGEMTALIEGVCVAGLLRGEAGLHRMVRGKTSKDRRESGYLRVDVIPWVSPESFDIPDGNLTVKSRGVKKNGVIAKKLRSAISLTHKPTGLSVDGLSPAPLPEGREEFIELLRARLGADEREEITPDVLVRTYHHRPQKWARDEATGIKNSNLDAVLDGDIDPFLRAHLDL